MVDMHIHTNNSDGQYSTIEIVEMLKKLDVELFSITDHDNVDSCLELEKINLQDKIKYIPGIEFSAINGIYNCHILGYNIDYKNINLINECKIIKQRRLDKIKIIMKNLNNKHNIYLSEEEQNSIFNKTGTTGRFDLCRILMGHGYGKKQEIYEKYLSNIEGIKTHRSNIENITEIIKDANGISILAHPKEIEEDYKINIENIIEDFIEKGINGIEVYNSIHTLQDVKRYILLAKKYNLLITGGSDFHGASHPERTLGTTTQEKIKIYSSNLKLR